MSANRQILKLEKIARLASEIIEEVRSASSSSGGAPKRRRRAGKDLITFRKMLKAERKKGVPVVELAQRHGVSAAYIYQLK